MAIGRKESGVAVRRKSAPSARPEPLRPFPTADRFTRSGHRVGDICFECECRVLEIGGPEGMLLGWCDCAWPEDHADMEVG
jgi:hypothetical protein